MKIKKKKETNPNPSKNPQQNKKNQSKPKIKPTDGGYVNVYVWDTCDWHFSAVFQLVADQCVPEQC